MCAYVFGACTAQYGNRGKTAIAFAFNADFQGVIQQYMVSASAFSESGMGMAQYALDYSTRLHAHVHHECKETEVWREVWAHNSPGTPALQ
jgi:hypothetical protein